MKIYAVCYRDGGPIMWPALFDSYEKAQAYIEEIDPNDDTYAYRELTVN